MLIIPKEKLNEAIMMLNKNLQEINIQNMDTELVAQMFKNYQSNVLFHLEGWCCVLRLFEEDEANNSHSH